MIFLNNCSESCSYGSIIILYAFLVHKAKLVKLSETGALSSTVEGENFDWHVYLWIEDLFVKLDFEEDRKFKNGWNEFPEE